MVLLVKLKSEGKVRMMVAPALDVPVGVVKRIVWLEAVEIFTEDIVSERAVKEAASARSGKQRLEASRAVRVRLAKKRTFFIWFCFNSHHCITFFRNLLRQYK
jgi:hypothetical protein